MSFLKAAGLILLLAVLSALVLMDIVRAGKTSSTAYGGVAIMVLIAVIMVRVLE